MAYLYSLLSGLLLSVLGVAARLAVQYVDVDEVSEASEHVFQSIRRRRRRVADDEQPGGGRSEPPAPREQRQPTNRNGSRRPNNRSSTCHTRFVTHVIYLCMLHSPTSPSSYKGNKPKFRIGCLQRLSSKPTNPRIPSLAKLSLCLTRSTQFQRCTCATSVVSTTELTGRRQVHITAPRGVAAESSVNTDQSRILLRK